MENRKSSISAEDLVKLYKSGEVKVIDVRSESEFLEGQICGSINIPIDLLPGYIARFPKDQQLVTVCNTGGGRSDRAAETLRALGWQSVFWLEGGFRGWVDAGFTDCEPGQASS